MVAVNADYMYDLIKKAKAYNQNLLRLSVVEFNVFKLLTPKGWRLLEMRKFALNNLKKLQEIEFHSNLVIEAEGRAILCKSDSKFLNTVKTYEDFMRGRKDV